MRAQTFRGTPATAALWQPYISPGQLLDSLGGVPLGPDPRTGRLVVIDPPTQQNPPVEGLSGEYHSMIIDIFGEKNGGKTTLMRTLFVRLMRLQAGTRRGNPTTMRGRINSRKPEGEIDNDDTDTDVKKEESEFKALTDCLHSEVFSPAEHGSVNLFDPLMGMSYADILQTAINISEHMAEVTLSGLEPLVLQIGVWKMMQKFKATMHPRVLESIILHLDFDSDVKAYYDADNADLLVQFSNELEAEPELKQELQAIMSRPNNLNQEEFTAAAGRVASYLGLVTQGVAGKLFAGTGSLYDIMSRDMVTIEWDNVNDKARALLEAMMYKWQMRNPALRPHINLEGELGTALDSLILARYKYNFVKKARAYETIEISDTQHRFDISHKGEPGSPLRSYAEGILLGAGAQMFTRQPENTDVLNDIAQLGISDMDVASLTTLPVGRFAVKVPGRPMSLFDLALTESDWLYNQGNAATKNMTNRQNVWTNEQFIERARQLGVDRIGAKR